MSEVAQAAVAAPAAPATQVAPAPVADAATKPTDTPAAQAAPAPPEPKKESDIARRAELLAKARRAESKLREREDAIKLRETQMAEDQRLASEFRRLHKLQLEDPYKYAQEIKLEVPELAKRYMAEKQGLNKTAVEIAKEAAAEEYERRDAQRKAASDKADAEAKEKAHAESIKRQADAYASAAKQIEQIVSSEKSAFRHLAALPDSGVDLTWKLLEKSFVANGRRLEGMPTFKEAAAGAEHAIRERLKAQDAAEEAAKKTAAEATKKPETKAVSSASRAKEVVETTKQTSPTPYPQRRIQQVTDYRAIARQLVAESKAAQDS